jgi:hypothetical protein
MANELKKNGTGNPVIDRALALGLKQSQEGEREFEVELRLTAAQRNLVLELCNLFGLSARSLLNAALRYALFYAEARAVDLAALPEYPRRLTGNPAKYALTAETLGKAREADVLDRLPAATLTGIKLLQDRVLKI